MTRFKPAVSKRAMGSILGIASLIGTIASASDQEFTTPETVSPEVCDVSPLTSSDLVEIVAAGTPTVAESQAVDSSRPVPDKATEDGIIATVRESVACTNANDPLRALALFTDRYLQERFGGGTQDDLGHLLAAATRDYEAADELDRLTLVSIDNLRNLEDGRVAADVTTSNAETTFFDTLVFAQRDNRWLIDEIIARDPPSSPTPAD